MDYLVINHIKLINMDFLSASEHINSEMGFG